MKTLIFILIVVAFLQASFLGINLCLSIILARSLCLEDKSNFFLALVFGLFLGLLSSTNIGVWAIIFIVVVKIANLLRRLPFAANLITIFPLSLIIFLGVHFVLSLVLKKSLDFNLALIEALVTLPVYILVRFWEERFTIHSEIKLKISNK